MDPTECFKRLLEALNIGDIEEAAASAVDFCDWRGRGGFMPQSVLKTFAEWLGEEATHMPPNMPEHHSER